jgi:hypothetical protein
MHLAVPGKFPKVLHVQQQEQQGMRFCMLGS